MRISFLSSDVSSLIFKIVHDILPTESRVSNILRNNTASCKRSCPQDISSDTCHVFFECSHSIAVGSWLSDLVKRELPSVSQTDILLLQIDARESMIWIIGHTFFYIWENRKKSKAVSTDDCIANLRADANILIETTHFNTALEILDYLC